MAIQKLHISIEQELLDEVKAVQSNMVGFTNISSLVNKLLIQWLQQFRRVE
jgi:metal-responsive CopG/Arc/MetJ family transcriptional regulator